MKKLPIAIATLIIGMTFCKPCLAEIVATENNDEHLYLNQLRTQQTEINGSISGFNGYISGGSYGINDFYITKGKLMISDETFLSLVEGTGVSRKFISDINNQKSNRAVFPMLTILALLNMVWVS